MHRKLLSLTVACAVSALCSSAQANIFIHASLNNFGFRLVDLNPDDNIAPAITFRFAHGPGEGGSEAVARLFQNTMPFSTTAADARSDGFEAFKRMTVGTALPGMGSTAGMRGSFAGHSASLMASGFMLTGQAPRVTKSFDAEVSPVSDNRLQFEVTPSTGVIFAGNLLLRARTTRSDSGLFSEHAIATFGTGISSEPNVVEGKSFSAEAGLGTETQDSRVQQRVRFTYTNRGTDQAVGFFNAGIFIEGSASFPPLGSAVPSLTAPMAPIPEPGSAALILCGLSMVAGVARYKKQ